MAEDFDVEAMLEAPYKKGGPQDEYATLIQEAILRWIKTDSRKQWMLKALFKCFQFH